MFITYSVPKIYKWLAYYDKLSMSKEVLAIQFDKFLFIAIFSYYLDFDKFLIYYENINYQFFFEIYTACHKFIYNRLIYSANGLNTL